MNPRLTVALSLLLVAACSGRQSAPTPEPADVGLDAPEPEEPDEVVEVVPPSTDRERGVQAMLAGQMSAAVGWFEMALVTAPDDPEVLINLAIARLALGERDAAIREALTAESLRPDDARIRFDRAAIQARAGLYELAIVALEELVDDPEVGAMAQDHLAAALLASDRLEDAERVLAASASARPRDPRVENHLGILAEGRGDQRAALGHYGRALDADPDALEPLRNRAILLIAMERYRAAERDLEQYLLTAPFETFDRGAMQGRIDRLRAR